MTEFVLKIVISKLMGRLDSKHLTQSRLKAKNGESSGKNLWYFELRNFDNMYPVNNSGTKFRKRTLLCKYSLENLKFYVLSVKMALYGVAYYLIILQNFDIKEFSNSVLFHRYFLQGVQVELWTFARPG